MSHPAGSPPTRVRPSRVAGGLAVVTGVALVAALVAALTTGALEPRLLLDPGPWVRFGGLAVGVVRDLALALVLGGLVLLAAVLPPPVEVARPRTTGERHARRTVGSEPVARTPRAGEESARRGAAPPALRVPEPPDAAVGIAARFQLTHRPHQDRRPVAHPGEGRAWERVRRVVAIAAIVWFPAQALDVLATHLSVTGSSVSDASYGAQLWQFVTEIELGRNLGLAVLFAGIAAGFVVAVGGLTSAAWALGIVLVAIIPVALTGHAAGAAAHDLAVSGIYLHLVGVGVWTGGLILLATVGRALGSDVARTAHRFSVVAGWSVVLVLVSGVASSLVRLETPLDLVTHPYGRLVAVKLLLTVLLMAAGWAHRTRVLPRIDAAVAHEASAGPAGPSPTRRRSPTRRLFRRLLVGEALVIAAVTGLGAALSSSAPPVPQEEVPDPSPVFALSGYPEPPPPSVSTYVTHWHFDPLVSLVCVVALVLYVRWVVRLGRRGDHWAAGRTVSWVLGLVVLFWVTQGGPAVYGRILFSAHMFEHMMLAMVIPILLVLGAPVTLAVRALPHRDDGSRGGREWLLALVGSRWAQFWAHPIVAAINFSGSLFVFYYTPLFELALTTHPGHLAMILHFTLAGYMFANAIIGIDPGPSRPPYLLRLVLLLATMASHAFFAVSIFSLTTLLAPDYFGWLGLSWGVDALADQEIGGNLTWGLGEVPTLAMAVGVGVLWAKDDAKETRRRDRRADRDGDAELAAYNEMLARRYETSGAPRDAQ